MGIKIIRIGMKLLFQNRNSESWVKAKKGVYQLGRDFYENSGGIFERSSHYENMFLKN